MYQNHTARSPLAGFGASCCGILFFCIVQLMLSNALTDGPPVCRMAQCILWAGSFLLGISVLGWLLFLLREQLRTHSLLCKRILAVLGLLTVLWNLTSAGCQLLEDFHQIQPYRINGEETEFTRITAMENAYGEMKLLGQSEFLSSEPEQTAANEDLRWLHSLLWRWPNDAVLPMLSLQHGSWILLLYWSSFLFWCAAAWAGWRQLRSGSRVLYGSCAIPVFLALAGPGLDSLGFVHYLTGHPFLLSDDPRHMLPCLLRLGLMGLMLYAHQRNPLPEEIPLSRKLALCEKILMKE